MSTQDPFIANMEWRCGVNDPLDTDEPEELTQVQRLDFPKCALVTPDDKLQQALASAYSVYLASTRATL